MRADDAIRAAARDLLLAGRTPAQGEGGGAPFPVALLQDALALERRVQAWSLWQGERLVYPTGAVARWRDWLPLLRTLTLLPEPLYGGTLRLPTGTLRLERLQGDVLLLVTGGRGLADAPLPLPVELLPAESHRQHGESGGEA